jgi:hypothetical protein
MAAVAAAQTGAAVRLVEPGGHIGGMVSGGLSWTDVGTTGVIGGLARAFYEAVADHYGAGLFALRGPEPHVAEQILRAMLEAASVEVSLGEPLAGVDHGREAVDALRTVGRTHRAAVFVDASYEGDLMAGAGVPYRVGRESRGLYGEHWAGRQPAYRPGKHNFACVISPFGPDAWSGDGADGAAEHGGPAVAGDAADTSADRLLPLIRPPRLDRQGWPAERLGEGDGGLQGYGFRVCLTDRPANAVPFHEPRGYDPSRFELLRRYLYAAGDRVGARDLLGLVPDLLPGGKCDVNSIGPFSLNLLDGSNRDYPDGDARTRERVREYHLAYSHQLLYFLGHDDGVPDHVRREIRRWGLCADEFADTGHWPHQLYIRDGRRMTGSFVLTEHDLLGARSQPDSVAIGSYNIDIREVERTWRYLPEYDRTAAVFNEGYLSVAVPPYPIPYRVLVPSGNDCTNLLVPVCCSVSHVAFGSVRTEPTLMLLGEAAGTAAALAALGGSTVQQVDVGRVQRALAESGRAFSARRRPRV